MAIAPASIDAELIADAFPSDPYPTYRRLREEDHVHWSEPWGQWLLSRYEDVVRVLREPETFGSAGWESRFLDRFPADDQAHLPNLLAHFRPAAFLSITDPPAHARMRRPVVRTLTPRVIAKVEPFIERVIETLFDEIERAGRFDGVRDFGYLLPGSVITEMMGLPLEDRDRFLAWSEDVVDFVSTGSPSIERALQAEASMAGLRRYLDAFIDARRTDPDDGIVSLLVETGGLADPLSQDELIATATAVVTAGHETTANLIGNGILALLRDPAQMERLRKDPALATPAVEEFLRYDAPLQRFRRVARRDVELDGRVIHEGQLIMAFGGSANRDPAVFENPDALDVGRSANPHLAFGHGIHFCVGAALSRLEGRIVFERLPRRFPDLRLDPDSAPVWRRNIAFRGLDTLPVRVD
jgi:pimeloyl-[acyl-carrier protein] synthase